MLFISLGNKKGLGLDLLYAIRKQPILSSEFSKEKSIRTETLKPYQDKLEEMQLITVEVMRNEKGRPNQISITNKGKNVLNMIDNIQKELSL